MRTGRVRQHVGRFFLILITLVVVLMINVVVMIYMFCNGPSTAARDLFVTTMLETGQLKFVVSWFLDEKQIQEAIANNSLVELDAELDTNLITVENAAGELAVMEEQEQQAVSIEEISGRTFFAKMMLIKDPSKVKVGTTYPWGAYGKELGEIVEQYDALAGVNGGLYQSAGNTGGYPCGIVVSEGEIQYNSCSGVNGLFLVGFNEDNILLIKDLRGMNNAQVEQLVQEERVRDAVVFQEENSDANNHFVPLLINGEARLADGLGSGANPRTAIGQRADGTVLLLVTDGRGTSGHLGATATDLIQIMQEYGAVNAANIDGGSSSSMYYDGNYEMTSVTFYYANSSWKLPTAFLVTK